MMKQDGGGSGPGRDGPGPNKKESRSNFDKKRGKKNQISLNHLLHYQSYKELDEYKTRRAGTRPGNGGSGTRARRSSGGRSSGTTDRYKVLHGMEYINLNYKFVVDYKANYKPQELDPNVPVNLDDIIRILAPMGNPCPICLSDEPEAPRMLTACGHILCLKCLLSMLDTEIPTFKKRESNAVVEKYRECPLCATIIRSKDVKPVTIMNIDERFEVPKVGDDVVMTLMSRPYTKLFSVPRALEHVHYEITNFPWISQADLVPYLRLFKADLPYILATYHAEKAQILATYEAEKALYDDDGKFVRLALAEIDKDIELWSQKSDQTVPQVQPAKSETLNSSNSFFYYQTGFNSRVAFVLSPLDIKVLKSNYGDDYANLPSSVIAKVENIQYEELTPENSVKRYKYLAHLPLGTTIGFLQCNWYKNEFISGETWDQFKTDLSKRTKRSQQKLQKEERDRKRAQLDEERRTKQFFEQENNRYYNIEEEEESYGNFGGLTITDNRMPALQEQDGRDQGEAQGEHGLENGLDKELDHETPEQGGFRTTVWGTRIKKDSSEADEDWEAEEMIRKAREQMNKQGKKKKKVVLSST